MCKATQCPQDSPEDCPEEADYAFNQTKSKHEQYEQQHNFWRSLEDYPEDCPEEDNYYFTNTDLTKHVLDYTISKGLS
jgi:hypothetical protein